MGGGGDIGQVVVLLVERSTRRKSSPILAARVANPSTVSPGPCGELAI